jgi:hypothetical protein
LEQARAKRIAAYAPFKASITAPAEERARLKEWTVEMMLKFAQLFRPRLSALP